MGVHRVFVFQLRPEFRASHFDGILVLNWISIFLRYNHFMEYTGVHISGATEEDMWTYFICSNYNPYKCSNSMIPCNRACVSCDYSHMTDSCYGSLDWAQKVGIRWYSQWYPDFQYITGQFPWQASFSDMQRYFKCKGYHAEPWRCGGLEFPCTCSHPPCNTCSV